MVDPCKLAMTPMKETLGRGLNTVFTTVNDELNSKVLNKIGADTNILTNTVNDAIGAVEHGMNGAVNAVNDISNDIHELLKLVAEAGSGSILALMKIYILPFVVGFTNTMGIAFSRTPPGKVVFAGQDIEEIEYNKKVSLWNKEAIQRSTIIVILALVIYFAGSFYMAFRPVIMGLISTLKDTYFVSTDIIF